MLRNEGKCRVEEGESSCERLVGVALNTALCQMQEHILDDHIRTSWYVVDGYAFCFLLDGAFTLAEYRLTAALHSS